MGILDNKVHLALVAIAGFAIIGMVVAGPGLAANAQDTPAQQTMPDTEQSPGADTTGDEPRTTTEESPFGDTQDEIGTQPETGEQMPGRMDTEPDVTTQQQEDPFADLFNGETTDEQDTTTDDPFGTTTDDPLGPTTDDNGVGTADFEALQEDEEGRFSSSVVISPEPGSEVTVSIEGAGLSIQDLNVDHTGSQAGTQTDTFNGAQTGTQTQDDTGALGTGTQNQTGTQTIVIEGTFSTQLGNATGQETTQQDEITTMPEEPTTMPEDDMTQDTLPDDGSQLGATPTESPDTTQDGTLDGTQDETGTFNGAGTQDDTGTLDGTGTQDETGTQAGTGTQDEVGTQDDAENQTGDETQDESGSIFDDLFSSAQSTSTITQVQFTQDDTQQDPFGDQQNGQTTGQQDTTTDDPFGTTTDDQFGTTDDTTQDDTFGGQTTQTPGQDNGIGATQEDPFATPETTQDDGFTTQQDDPFATPDTTQDPLADQQETTDPFATTQDDLTTTDDTTEPPRAERTSDEGFFKAITFSPTAGSWVTITIEGTGVEPQGMSVQQTMESQDTFSIRMEVRLGSEGTIDAASADMPPTSSATISMNPSFGAAGETIIINGTEFESDQTFSATVAGQDLQTTTPLTSDEQGNISSEFTVPEGLESGAQRVVVNNDAGHVVANGWFTVVTDDTTQPGTTTETEDPLADMTPDTTMPDTTQQDDPFATPDTTQQDNGFGTTPQQDDTQQDPFADQQNGQTTDQQDTTTDDQFGTTQPDTTQDQSPFGVMPDDTQDDQTQQDTTDETGQTTDASITLDPTSGAADSTVAVNGEGFEANTNVVVSFDRLQVEEESVTADESGAFSASITIPSDASEGEHEIMAHDDAGNSATETFTVEGSEQTFDDIFPEFP
jgi:hypothetical protein